MESMRESEIEEKLQQLQITLKPASQKPTLLEIVSTLSLFRKGIETHSIPEAKASRILDVIARQPWKKLDSD